MVTDSPETRYARSADGKNLAYQVSGDGPLDLVLMLPIPIDLMWEDPGLIRIRKRLGTFSRTVWRERRGLGASEGDPLDAMVGKVYDADLSAILDAVGSERAALVGFAHDGPSVIHFASTHRERVSALVLLNTYAHYVREDDYPWGFPAQALDRYIASIKKSRGTGADLELLAPSRFGDERFGQWWARCERLGGGPDQIADLNWASCERDVRPLLGSLRVPTLVVHRQGDRLIRLGAGLHLAENIPGAKLVVLPGEDHLFFVGDSDALLDEIEEFLTGQRQGIEGDSVLATVLFTDIVNSTQQAGRMGQRAWSKVTDEHDAMVRAALHRHRGREVKTMGDGFLATFDAGTRAVRCATDIVGGAKTIGLEIRAGVHTGEVEFRDADVAGMAVTIGKRVCDLAAPSQVLISETVRCVLVGSEITLSDQGIHSLKGVADEWRLFAVEA